MVTLLKFDFVSEKAVPFGELDPKLAGPVRHSASVPFVLLYLNTIHKATAGNKMQPVYIANGVVLQGTFLVLAFMRNCVIRFIVLGTYLKANAKGFAAVTEWDAAEKRISCRACAARPMEEPTLEKLRECMAQLCKHSGLPFRLCTAPAGQPVIKLSGAMFSETVSVCTVLVGAADPLKAEKIDYYRQELVLFVAPRNE